MFKIVKLYSALLICAFFLAFYSGYSWFGIRQNLVAGPEEMEEILELKLNFFQSEDFLLEIDLGYFYPTSYHQQLLYTEEEKNNYSGQDKKVLAALFSSAMSCKNQEQYWIFSGELERDKFRLWEQIRCGTSQLPEKDFFLLPPYLHPSGFSYMYLAYKLHPHFRTREWLKENLKYFHLKELDEIKEELGKLPNPYHFLSTMDNLSKENLYNGDVPLLTKEFLFFPYKDYFQVHNLIYYIYSRTKLEDYLAKSQFTISKVHFGKSCLFVDGEICWNFTTKQLMQHVSLKTFVPFLLLVLFVMILLILLMRTFKKEAIEDEKRRMALRILGHELRTPIASMMLAQESLLHHLDELSEEAQETFLRMTSSTHRLHRLVEMSKNYLAASLKNSQSLISTQFRMVPSIRDYLEDIAQDFPEVEYQFSGPDSSFILDEYWCMICVKNLLSNACVHGKDPRKMEVRINSEVLPQILEIKVITGGTCDFESLEVMSQEFVKGKKSEGTGLGLNIVVQVLKAIGGELHYSKNPTTFSLQLREKYEKNSFNRR